MNKNTCTNLAKYFSGLLAVGKSKYDASVQVLKQYDYTAQLDTFIGYILLGTFSAELICSS